MWDLMSTTRDWTCTPCSESVEPYHQGGPKETVTELMSLWLAEGESIFLPGFNLPVRLYVAVIEKVQREAWWRKSVEIQWRCTPPVSSVTQLCLTLCTRLPCPSPTPGAYSNSSPSRRWCHSTISSSVVPFSSRLQSFPASGSFSSELILHIRWPTYWSFSFSISPSNEHPGLISFRTDWLDLLAVQGTLKSLLQHHSSKASILWHSAFFILQLSHPYMTTGKTIALT